MLNLIDNISALIMDALHSVFGVQRVQPVPVILPEPKAEKVYRISKSYSINPKDFGQDGQRFAILASSRMGKGYLAGKLFEQKLRAKDQLFIFDPQGEYFSLQEKFDILIFGGTQEAKEKRLTLSIETILDAVKLALENKASMIIDLSLCITDDEKCEYFALISNYIFNYMAAIPKANLFHVTVVIEEAAYFCPQKPKDHAQDSLQAAITLFALGAKYGINTYVITQRLSRVDKTIFSQCTLFFFGKIVSPQDYKAVSDYTGQFNISQKMLEDLVKYQFYACHHGKSQLIVSDARECTHGGATPQDTLDLRKPKKTVKDLYEQLK